jgi:hypothetical protein
MHTHDALWLRAAALQTLAAQSCGMSTKSRAHLYGTTIRMSAERANEARKEADRLACEAWNYRMLGYKGPAQPSPTLGDALNAGYRFRFMRTRLASADAAEEIACAGAAGR